MRRMLSRDVDGGWELAYKGICTKNLNHTTHRIHPNPNRNPITKQHAIVNIQLNIVACATFPDKFIRDNVVAPFVRL